MFCKNCGNKIQDNAHFCPACGIRIVVADDANIKNSDVQSENTEKNCQCDINPEAADLPPEVMDGDDIAKSVKNPEESETAEQIAGNSAISEAELHISDDGTEEKQAHADNKGVSDLIYENETNQADCVKAASKENNQNDCKNKKVGGSKAFSIILRTVAIIVAAVLFALIVSTSLYGAFYAGFNPKSINTYIDKAEISNIVINDKSLAEFVYDKCDGEVIAHYNITIDGIEEILNKADANSAVSDIVMPYVEYYFGLTDSYPENMSECIVQLIKSNEDTIENALNYRMDDEDYAFISNEAQTAFAEVSTFIKSDANKMVRMVSRRYLYVAMIVAAVIFGLLLFVSNKFKMLRTLGDIGGVLIASAAFMLIVLGYVSLILVFPFMPDYILEFVMPIRNAIAIRTLIFAAVGFVLSVIYWSVSAVKRGKTKKSV